MFLTKSKLLRSLQLRITLLGLEATVVKLGVVCNGINGDQITVQTKQIYSI